MKAEDLTWVDPNAIPDVAHLLHFKDTWCVTNARGEVAVYKMGTGRNDANSLQGNRHPQIVEKLAEAYRDFGAVGISKIPHVFLPDSPGRY